MISLHAGRLLLVCSRSDRTWHARVVLGPKPEHQLEADTGTVHLQDALLRAQSIYQAALVQLRPEGGQRMCWDCLQWDLGRSRCELGIPEAKRSGGRFAPNCEMYEAAVR
jgi:hypothetical protein